MFNSQGILIVGALVTDQELLAVLMHTEIGTTAASFESAAIDWSLLRVPGPWRVVIDPESLQEVLLLDADHVREDFVDEREINIVLVIDLDQTIDHGFQVNVEESDQLLRLGDPHLLRVKPGLGIVVLQHLQLSVVGVPNSHDLELLLEILVEILFLLICDSLVILLNGFDG